jgi:DNA mismatch endonuclease (patch repair protein)
VAVFVDGCFWHGCRWHCTYAKAVRAFARQDAETPSTRLKTGRAFWLQKLAGNTARDRLVNRQLRRQGWRVVRIWEHELAAGKREAESGKKALERIRRALAAGRG